MFGKKKFFFLNFQKLAGLWLVGEVDNHVVIYGSKVAEGFCGVPTSVLFMMLFLILKTDAWLKQNMSCCCVDSFHFALENCTNAEVLVHFFSLKMEWIVKQENIFTSYLLD